VDGDDTGLRSQEMKSDAVLLTYAAGLPDRKKIVDDCWKSIASISNWELMLLSPNEHKINLYIRKNY